MKDEKDGKMERWKDENGARMKSFEVVNLEFWSRIMGKRCQSSLDLMPLSSIQLSGNDNPACMVPGGHFVMLRRYDLY